MAVMDDLLDKVAEKGKKASNALSQIAQSMADLPNKPAVYDPSVRISIKKENSNGYGGPSPEKDSGQDRFRRMLAGDPPFVDLNSNPSNHSLGFSNPGNPDFRFPTDGFLGLAPSDNMAHLNHVAVNPAIYPAAAGMAQPVPQPRMTTSINDARLDFGILSDHVLGQHLGDGKNKTWTSILSRECQKRSFNPAILEFINEDGTYQCSIGLNGKTIRDSRSWSNPHEAKQSLARRAVEYVRKLPLPRGPRRGPSRGPEQRFRSRDGNSRADVHPQGRAQTVDADDERRFLARIQTLYGQEAGPSPQVMANPEASRAFLQGFALGSQLPSSARDVRRRSRSPLRASHGQHGPVNRPIKRE